MTRIDTPEKMRLIERLRPLLPAGRGTSNQLRVVQNVKHPKNACACQSGD